MGEFYGNQHTGPKYCYQDLVDGVRLLAAELGHPPTTEDADNDERLPSVGTIYNLTDSWQKVLNDADAGQTQVEQYGVEERADMCADLRRVHRESDRDHLPHREYDNRGQYPTSVVKKHFGSWKEACRAAGIDSGTRYGQRCRGPNGKQLDSWHEKRIATWLHEHGFEYEVHPPLDETNWVADFYLPAGDLWIEVDGFGGVGRPNSDSFGAKLEHYKENDMRFVVVERTEDLIQSLLDRGMGID